VLKKAGIIVATSAAAILAAAPLAMAHGHGGYDHSPVCKGAKQDARVYNPQNAEAYAFLGAAAINLIGSVTPQVQAPIASCNNVEDVLNTHIHDSFNRNVL
jgi:hypothetical protein